MPTPSTAPNVTGPVTLSIQSFIGMSGAAMQWNVGDTQPLVQLQMQENGTSVSLLGAVCTLNFYLPGAPSPVQSSVMALNAGVLSYERQVGDYTTVNAGEYYATVSAVWPDGTGFSGPDEGSPCVVVVHSAP